MSVYAKNLLGNIVKFVSYLKLSSNVDELDYMNAIFDAQSYESPILVHLETIDTVVVSVTGQS